MVRVWAKRAVSLFYNIYVRVMNRHVHIGYRCRILFGTRFGGYNSIGDRTVFGGELGSNSYIGGDGFLIARIGSYCSIGNGVKTVFGRHPSGGFVSTHPVFFSLEKKNGNTYVTEQKYDEAPLHPGEHVPLIIGHDVWIGSGVTFVGRITVGDGAIIAANATVIRDVAPYTIVGGVPAGVIRKRFTDEQIRFLLAYRWWDKPEEWLRVHADEFADIGGFMARHINETAGES